MKTLLTILTIVVIALAAPSPILAQQGNAEAQFRAILDEIVKANVRSDTATLDKYLADDFLRIRSNGVVQTKTELFDAFKSGKLKVAADDISELMKVSINGDTAVVITTETQKGALAGKDFSGQAHDARVFVKRGGEWKLILRTSTKVAP